MYGVRLRFCLWLEPFNPPIGTCNPGYSDAKIHFQIRPRQNVLLSSPPPHPRFCFPFVPSSAILLAFQLDLGFSCSKAFTAWSFRQKESLYTIESYNCLTLMGRKFLLRCHFVDAWHAVELLGSQFLCFCIDSA